MKMDPLSDALSTINNAEKAGKLKADITPASKLIGRVFDVMQENGYLGEFEYIDNDKGGEFKVKLIGNINKCGSIKPHFSTNKNEFEKWEKRYLPGKDFGILVISTPKGVMSHRKAQQEGIGGRLLAYVY
ncbi:Ribosomal protein S8 [Methanonatronarchaeum thermophilum]|uniref:Small ribosomal subunit protein uS8 n=1 Tax=Methanonatronarchaeum thermophilum TaxID=1927129 RepID=A0A1Y3GBI9_9EURY|nr:30S ribosomal protein S8 [Methanonatronarchaeum thermophilum]OUJ18831.1 Ribosomal protein S8 [Methanonatronarchaeum thermophilum]